MGTFLWNSIRLRNQESLRVITLGFTNQRLAKPKTPEIRPMKLRSENEIYASEFPNDSQSI